MTILQQPNLCSAYSGKPLDLYNLILKTEHITKIMLPLNELVLCVTEAEQIDFIRVMRNTKK
jgi:hypothetical protein